MTGIRIKQEVIDIEEEKEEKTVGEFFINYGHGRGYVEISPSDTLQDVRRLIDEFFDDDMFPENDKTNWHFWINDRRISSKQECTKLAWKYLPRIYGVSIRSTPGAVVVAPAAAATTTTVAAPAPVAGTFVAAAPTVGEGRDSTTASGTTATASSRVIAPSNIRPNIAAPVTYNYTVDMHDNNERSASKSRNKGRWRKKMRTREEVPEGRYFIQCPFCPLTDSTIGTFGDETLATHGLTKDDIMFVEGTLMVDLMLWQIPPRSFKRIMAYQKIRDCIRNNHPSVYEKLKGNIDDATVPALFRDIKYRNIKYRKRKSNVIQEEDSAGVGRLERKLEHNTCRHFNKTKKIRINSD